MYKTFVIVIKGDKVSEEYARISEMALKYNDVEFERFDAVTPDTLNRAPELVINHPNRTETEKACFASHFLLWKKCVELNQPIAIIEHDSIMVKPYPTYPRATAFLAYHYKDGSEWLMHGGAYIMFPDAAKDLIRFVTASVMQRQVDNILWRYFRYLGIKPFEKYHCFIINDFGGPRTIEHNKRT